jgi:hypothetical protein
MKKLWWFSRLLVILIALYFIVGSGGNLLQTTQADEGACIYGQYMCGIDQNNNCKCYATGCTHCIIQSGSSGCGLCYKPPEGD